MAHLQDFGETSEVEGDFPDRNRFQRCPGQQKEQIKEQGETARRIKHGVESEPFHAERERRVCRNASRVADHNDDGEQNRVSVPEHADRLLH